MVGGSGECRPSRFYTRKPFLPSWLQHPGQRVPSPLGQSPWAPLSSPDHRPRGAPGPALLSSLLERMPPQHHPGCFCFWTHLQMGVGRTLLSPELAEALARAVGPPQNPHRLFQVPLCSKLAHFIQEENWFQGNPTKRMRVNGISASIFY